LELLVRLKAGAALVSNAPQMKSPNLFAAIGWVVLLTTIGLFPGLGDGIGASRRGSTTG
jgi:hypothetical protein